MANRRRLMLTTLDGTRLNAVVDEPDRPGEPGGATGAGAAAVLCHPHPDMGGSMAIPVLGLLAARLRDAGVRALRFDFRRPGSEEERNLDVRAAIDEATRGRPDDGVVLVGWSYGADQALGVAATDERVRGVVAIAPTFRFAGGDIRDPSCPVLVLAPEQDQFTPVASTRQRSPWAEVRVLPGAGHFLEGVEEDIADAVVGFVLTPRSRAPR